MILRRKKTDESKTKGRKKQSANRIMANHLGDRKSLPEITYAVFAS